MSTPRARRRVKCSPHGSSTKEETSRAHNVQSNARIATRKDCMRPQVCPANIVSRNSVQLRSGVCLCSLHPRQHLYEAKQQIG